MRRWTKGGVEEPCRTGRESLMAGSEKPPELCSLIPAGKGEPRISNQEERGKGWRVAEGGRAGIFILVI